MIATQPSRRHISTPLPAVWIGYLIAILFVAVETVEAFSGTAAATEQTLLDTAVAAGGWGYWLWCIYRMHKVLAEATNNTHPINPGKAWGYFFIPFYNFYWLFKWPNEIANFVNRRSSRQMSHGWAGFFLLSGILLLRLVDVAVGLAVIFSVGIYLNRKINSALGANHEAAVIPTPATTAGQGFASSTFAPESLERPPSEPDVFLKHGDVARGHGDSWSAIAHYDLAIQFKPDYVQAYLDRGLAYGDAGLVEKATADFEKVLELTNDQALRQQAEQQLSKLEVK
jgi:tetratricopeptide (TPR) repeat protein